MKTPRQIEREARVLWRACLADGALDPGRARVVVDQTIRSNRTGSVMVLKRFLRRVRLDAARHTAEVTTAVPLDDRVRVDVEHALAVQHGGPVTTSFVVDRALIGGMRVKVGSDLYDGSVKGGLEALESRF
jgi:F-type H+-transporting ATPase subunit delta